MSSRKSEFPKQSKHFETLKMELSQAPIPSCSHRTCPLKSCVINVILLLGQSLWQRLSESHQPYLVLVQKAKCIRTIGNKYLLAKPDAMPRLLRWILLLQEFDVVIRDKKGA
ncbi:hypothetical protein Tco_0016765 [Tanacetum coccineum]